MFFRGSRPDIIDHWVCVLERNLEYEVVLARNFLANLKIPSNILSKRDSAHSLNIGEMSLIYLYVPEEFEKRACKALATFMEELDESTILDEDGDLDESGNLDESGYYYDHADLNKNGDFYGDGDLDEDGDLNENGDHRGTGEDTGTGEDKRTS